MYWQRYAFPLAHGAAAAACLLTGLAAVVIAQTGPAAEPGRERVVAARGTAITGSAWNADSSPIPQARVRLRSLQSGRIEAVAMATEAGRFAFASVEGGSYLVELVSESGKVLAVGNAFAIAPGETVATFVRLGTRVPWYDGFFSNAAAAVASSAAAAGITAIAPEQVRPVSARQ